MTVKEWLEGLASTTTSSDKDSNIMQNLLRQNLLGRVAFPNAVVVAGVVYPEGSGQSLDIHMMAKIILERKRNE